MNGKRFLVTGGAGFIGSAVVRHLVGDLGAKVLVIDKLTYAGNLASLAPVEGRYEFLRADICNRDAIASAFVRFRPDAVIHLAAESHVDRSIDGPAAFIETNLVGTFVLLEAAAAYWRGLESEQREAFRFHHVSTDEVFGALGHSGKFTEQTTYDPRSPYSASKAGSDHLVRAWHHTYGLPVVITNCSNNYGPFHFPEKLIPLMILKGLSGQAMPVYGQGDNVRDWLHVEDHARAIVTVAARGVPGETYLVGGNAERSNLEVVEAICDRLDELVPKPADRHHREQIAFVEDRPGHDFRYAIDASRIRKELGWEPQLTFEAGLAETVRWYLDNREWWEPLAAEAYRGDRLGLAAL